MANIPKLLAKHLGSRSDLGFRTMTLVKVTPGTRTPGSLIDGTNSTTVEYAIKAMRERTSQAEGNARFKTATLTILGAPLIAAGVEPASGDRITDGAVTWTIVAGGVESDPVSATYTCQVQTSGG